tara:strand:+ start:4966 stop:5817 length:852 start_codon:yes stop_codon:yes gene_type:complete
MESIKLSILIPTYNYRSGFNKILDSIESIEDDLRDYIEIIISDDSDEEIIQKNRNDNLEKLFKNYIYNRNVDTLGAVNNWNKLISKAKGDYIWLLHHDESWQKEKNLIKYIFQVINMAKPNILILPILRSKNINFNNFKIQISNRHITYKKILGHFIKNPKLLFKTNIIGPPSSLIYKKNTISYDKRLKYLVDVEFYIRLFNFYNSKKIIVGSNNYNLISCQNNKNSITKSLRKQIRSLKNKERILIISKYKFNYNFQEKILSLYSFIILKINLILTTKINIY